MKIHSPKHMSFSRAKLFQQCPKKYYYRYVAEIPEESGPAATKGSFIHQVLEELYELKPDLRTLEAAKIISSDSWELSEEYKQLPDDEAVKLKKEIWSYIQNYFTLEQPQFVNCTSTEMKVSSQSFDFNCIGFIDRVDDNNVIIDYKTGKKYPDHTKQLDFYAALYNNFQFDQIECKLIYVNSDPKKMGIDHFISSKENQEKIVEEIYKVFKELIALPEDEESFWKPYKSWLCKFCSYKDICPIFRANRNVNVKDMIDEARQKNKGG